MFTGGTVWVLTHGQVSPRGLQLAARPCWRASAWSSGTPCSLSPGIQRTSAGTRGPVGWRGWAFVGETGAEKPAHGWVRFRSQPKGRVFLGLGTL